MTTRRRTMVERDQAVSVFASILSRLCEATGASGAALVDRQGETVDYAGHVDPFDIKVAAAELRLLFRYLHESAVPTWPETDEIVVRAQRRSYFAVRLGEGYALVVQLPRHCFQVSRRALAEAMREVSVEAGLTGADTDSSERWALIDVRTSDDDRHKPVAVWLDGGWCRVEILGRYQDSDLEHREIGYRARLDSGAEVTLVREPLGRWFVDVLPAPAQTPEPQGV